MLRTKFKDFYFSSKDKKTFNTIFEKWYNRGHWGKINKEQIKKQQYDWYTKLKKMIKERDYDSILMSVENRQNKVSREMFSKITNINIKKKAGKIIRKKLKEFCLVEGKNEFSELKKYKKPLTDEERQKCIEAKAVWGDDTLAVWKSVNTEGEVTYVTNTHRAYNTAPTLKGAISRFHNFIKGTD
jgi:hypothetical protein